MTTKEAVLTVWQSMKTGKFTGISFIKEVKELLNKPLIYDDTVMRNLRRLRTDNKLNYKVDNIKKSIYNKLR